jgi:hypothetical protein
MTDDATPKPHNPIKRARVLGAAAILMLVGVPAASGYVAAALDHPIRDGDYVLYEFTIYDEHQTVLYTTDWDIAEPAIAAGNPYLQPKELAHNLTYDVRGGFLDLDAPDEGSFDHVPYLLSHREGDTVRTPLLKAPIADHPIVNLPRFVSNVATSFWVDSETLQNIIEETKGTPDSFLYAQDFPARVEESKDGQDRVQVTLEPGTVVSSITYGFPFKVLAADEDSVDLELLLEEGQVFKTSSCGVKLGIRPGEYRVIEATPEGYALRHVGAVNHVAGKDVVVEFEILEVKPFPKLFRAQVQTELKVKELTASIQALF